MFASGDATSLVLVCMCARACIRVCERVFARDGFERHSYACERVRITLTPILLLMLDVVLV